METAEYLDAVEANGRLLAAGAEGWLDVPVPCCPGWMVEDVVRHTGKVHRHITDRVRRGSTSEDDVTRVKAPRGEDVLPWFREGVADMLGVLGAADLDAPVWNWSATKPQTAAFWPRRMAQETVVHRADVDVARGAVDPIAPVLAADGVDEFFEVFLPLDVEAFTGDGPSVLVRTTDAPTAWTVTAGPGAAEIAREARGDPAATISGVASDVLLVLWRRLGVEAVDVAGDRELAERFLAATDLS